MPEEKGHICPVCGEPVEPDEPCYQLRLGAIDGDRITFLPEEDVDYYHQACATDLF